MGQRSYNYLDYSDLSGVDHLEKALHSSHISEIKPTRRGRADAMTGSLSSVNSRNDSVL